MMTDSKPDSRSESSLKIKTAHAIKWNSIDRVSTQVLYAAVGVILANLLPKEDFGLVGALLVFQAFAILFVDSGFGAALLRMKNPQQSDYSTVFWFNTILSIVIYWILWFSAPLIASIFHDVRLIALSKVMFLTFVFSALGIVQTNRLMKLMDVRHVAIANIISLIAGGIVGVWMATTGYGAWALVWQLVAAAAVKTGWLWIAVRWVPSLIISRESFAQIWRIGLSVFSSSFLNTLCLNIYSFLIGSLFRPLSMLGIYTQADKWSKMGSASISQVMTASFIPLLSKAQNNPEQFHRYQKKINRFVAFITFPFMIGLTIIGEPLFHTLFGTKWDAAIPLFQILCIRGIFIILQSLYTNYLLALGYGKKLITVEIIKDSMIIIAIFATVFFYDMTLLVWGQLIASFMTWILVLIITSRATGYRISSMITDLVPFLLTTLLMGVITLFAGTLTTSSILNLIIMVMTGTAIYVLLMRLLKITELNEAADYIFQRFTARVKKI